jgi:quercetin dioxygenase-like cupin family protein
MKIHANFCLPAFTHFDPTGYIPSPAAGVNRFMLDRIGDEKARATTIVEYLPNSKFPAHTHIGGEEFLVLDGSFHDEHGVYPAGTYVRNPVGSQHAPWVEGDGCTIFVKLLQMADSTSEIDAVPLYVDTAPTTMDIKSNTKNSGGHSLELYKNQKTGERVQMCWLEPGQPLAVDEQTAKSEEIFVVEGSLLLRRSDTKNQEEKEEYKKWGWLRFPVGSEKDQRRWTLAAGSAGAQVFRKTGHLTDHALAMEKVQIADDETFRVQ